MSHFVAPDFAIDVPDGAIDASNYAFVLPNNSESPPTIAILVQPEDHIPDLDGLVDQSIADIAASAENPEVKQRLVTQRGDWHYGMAVVEHGPPTVRSTQKTVILFVEGNPIRRYTIIGTARTQDFAQADLQFDAITRSFKPS